MEGQEQLSAAEGWVALRSERMLSFQKAWYSLSEKNNHQRKKDLQSKQGRATDEQHPNTCWKAHIYELT